MSPAISSSTASPGSATSSIARASGRAASIRRDLLGEDPLQPPARDVGEAQQAQRLAGRRAVDDDDVELARLVVALELQQAEELVHAGGTVSSSALMRSDAALDEDPAGPRPDRAQLRSSSSCALTPAGPRGARRRSARAERRACSASASECAGSVDITIVRRPAAAQRRAVAAATDVFPTPPLPV